MFNENRGELAESLPTTWAVGTHAIDMKFLAPYFERYAAPTVSEILIRFNGSISGAGGATTALDAAAFIQRCRLYDRGGEFYNLTGKLMRVVDFLETGAGHTDAPDGAVSSAATDTDYDIYARILFDVKKAARGKDFRVPLLHFVRGGQMQLQLQLPLNTVVNSGTVRAYFRIHEERERELKSRMVWREESITIQEQQFAIGGNLRAAFVSSELGASAGYTALTTEAAGNVDSRSLNYSQLPWRVLREFMRTQDGRFGRDTSTIDNPFYLAAPAALALVWPDEEQNIGNMVDLEALHYRSNQAVPTSGKMVTNFIEDRDAALAAEWMGFPTVQGLLDALNTAGRVKIPDGSAQIPIGEWTPKLRRRLPLRLT